MNKWYEGAVIVNVKYKDDLQLAVVNPNILATRYITSYEENNCYVMKVKFKYGIDEILVDKLFDNNVKNFICIIEDEVNKVYVQHYKNGCCTEEEVKTTHGEIIPKLILVL